MARRDEQRMTRRVLVPEALEDISGVAEVSVVGRCEDCIEQWRDDCCGCTTMCEG